MGPSLDCELSMVGGEDGFEAFDLDTQATLKHLHVLILVGVEVQGRLLRPELDQVGMVELEEHLEAEGAAWMGDDAGCDCAFEAG
jgi:hypothetical protein